MFVVEHFVLFYFNLLLLFISRELGKKRKKEKKKKKESKKKNEIQMEPKEK